MAAVGQPLTNHLAATLSPADEPGFVDAGREEAQ